MERYIVIYLGMMLNHGDEEERIHIRVVFQMYLFDGVGIPSYLPERETTLRDIFDIFRLDILKKFNVCVPRKNWAQRIGFPKMSLAPLFLAVLL